MIEAHDLWKGYGKLEVLKGLNLKINDGETVVTLGRSGVGKSVLLSEMIGIELPDKGYVEVNGKNISAMSPRDREKETKYVGMLFQGAALFDSMNVGENTAFYLRQHENLSEKEIQERVDKALEMVNLEGTKQKMPSELSGGMRKRAAIARLIVCRLKIVLYDEPTTGLDPITAAHINELINRTRIELQATSIVVPHDIRSAIEVGDRLAFHHEGKILHIAPRREFMKIDDPVLISFFKNATVTEELLKGL